MTGETRGQAYTLEGLIAAILLASAVLFGLQAVDVAPYAEDRDDRRLDSLRTETADALAVAGDSGALRRAVTCIDPSDGSPHPRLGQPPDPDPGMGNVTELGHVLNETLGTDNRRYVVLFDYWNESAAQVESALVYPAGASPQVRFTREPVTATYRVAVYDSTPVRGADCQPTGRTLAERVGDGDPLYLPESTHPASPDSETFAVVTVRVIAW